MGIERGVRMKTLLLALVLAVSSVAAASAVEFSTIESAGRRFTVCRVNVQREHLELFLRDEKGQPIKRFDKLAAIVQQRGQRLVFAMNAGMYLRDFSAQ